MAFTRQVGAEAVAGIAVVRVGVYRRDALLHGLLVEQVVLVVEYKEDDAFHAAVFLVGRAVGAGDDHGHVRLGQVDVRQAIRCVAALQGQSQVVLAGSQGEEGA